MTTNGARPMMARGGKCQHTFRTESRESHGCGGCAALDGGSLPLSSYIRISVATFLDYVRSTPKGCMSIALVAAGIRPCGVPLSCFAAHNFHASDEFRC